MSIRVECYAGSRSGEEPRAFVADGRRVEVMQVTRRWLEPGLRFFRVQGYDGNGYVLRQDERSGEWELTLIKPAGL
jgi:hypothetical protein